MKRRPLDAYYSPTWAVDELIKHLEDELLNPGRHLVLEPCCGDGAISNRLRSHGFQVVTNDMNQTVDAQYQYDYLDSPRLPKVGAEWIITNPPFSLAFPMLQKALDEVLIGVAFLLRLSFLEPTYNRSEFLSQNPPTGLIITPRISFTKDGNTDSVTTAWMVWLREPELWRQFIKVIPKARVNTPT